MTRYACICFGLVLLGGCESRIAVPIDALVVRNGTVIDGTGASPSFDAVVVIQGDRILAVGPASGFRIPEGIESRQETA